MSSPISGAPTPGQPQTQPQMDPQALQALLSMLPMLQQGQAPDPSGLIKNLIIQYAQKDLNVDVQSKGILALAQALKLLADAANPQQGIPPEAQLQMEQVKAQHEMNLKTAELQHKMRLREQELGLRMEQAKQKAQIDQQKALSDTQIKQEQAAQQVDHAERNQQLQEAVTVQNAQIQAAQAEQSLQQKGEAHQKQMETPATPKK